MSVIRIPTNYYQQFDADFTMDVPGEGYGGWKKADLPIDTDHTALAVMHAWDCGTREQYPGWHRAVEYIPRSYEICEKEFPPILQAVRKANMKVIHVVSGEDYCKDYPGYKMVKELVEEDEVPVEHAADDPVLQELRRYRYENVFPGAHNESDIKAGRAKMTFAKEAKPVDGEPIAKDSRQLFAYCSKEKINHLIYIGFAIDGCLLTSPGGMVDMSRKGIMCSAIRQAVTAIENRETARKQICKEIALWRVALLFGFVYNSEEFIKAIEGSMSQGQVR